MLVSWPARAAAWLAALLPAVASAALTVTPVTWNVIGLDSNSPASGPRYFPVGERVCSNTATGPITVTLSWDSANPYINLRAGSLNPITLPPITPPVAGVACADAYFEVDVTQVAAAYDTKRRFHVTASEGANTATSPMPRELYVEHLISQSRNGITAVKLNGVSIPAGGTMAMVVGGTYTIELDSFTATQGYNQFESFINFSNTVFQILSVQSTYSANTSPFVSSPSDKFYADACGWDPNPASPNYNTCVGGDYKTGGTVTTVYTVKIIGGGGTSQTLNTLLYDFSGSSFHYNADFGVGARIATIVDPTSLNFSKAFSPSTVPPGGTSSLVFTISNPNAAAIGGLAFNDTLPSLSGSPMVIAGAPTSSGCGTPSFTAVAGTSGFSMSNGSVAANAACVITLPVSVAATPTTGIYHNVSGNLFAAGTDTGKSAVADLTLASGSSGTGVCGLTMAEWNFTGYTTNPPPYLTKASNVATAVIGSGASITLAPDSGANGGNPVPGLSAYGWPNTGSINTAGTAYIEFQLDTSQYTAVNLAFDIRRKNAGPSTTALYYFNGTTWVLKSNLTVVNNAWTSSSFNFTGQTSTTGTTLFRIYGDGANNVNQGADLNLDNIKFTGCSTPVGPTLTKSFTPATIPVNGTSILTFTLSNPNTVALTGAKFTDALPAGVQVAATPNASTTCGNTPSWAPAAGATSLAYGQTTGATIPASSSCTASVTVTATTAGPHTNVSGYISTTESGTNATSSGFGVASLTALLPPSISKSFGAPSIVVNGQTTLTVTIVNPNPDTALTGVAFNDPYPANLVNTNPLVPAVVNTCGGSLTAAPGGNALNLSGGTVAAGGSCSITVPVTATAAGTLVNTTGNVSAAVVGNGNFATASIAVTPPNPAISLMKQVATSASGPWLKFVAADPATAQIYFRFVVENTGDVTLNPFSVSDPTLAGTGADPATCAWQTDNVPTTLPSLPAASPTLSPVATCVKGPIPLTPGSHTNVATASGTFGGNAVPSEASSTNWLGVVPGFSLLKQISLSADGPWTTSVTTAAGTNVYYRFTLSNTGNVPLTSIGVNDPLVSTASCTFIDPLPIGGATSCIVGPVVAAGAPGTTLINTATGQANNGIGTISTAPSSASYTIPTSATVLTVAKTGPANVTAGGLLTYTVVVGNSGPSSADGTIVVDPAVANFSVTGVTCPSATGGATCPATLTVAALQGAGLSIGTFPVGGSVTLSISGTAGASGTIVNTATATPPVGSPVSGTAPTTTINPNSNLTIGKTGPASVTAGGTISYTVVVTNTGPSAADGTLVTDPAVANFNVTGVTCPGATGGAACPATLTVAALQGAGLAIATFPAGGSVTLSITGTAGVGGAIVNTATATPPAGSPVSSTAPTTTINPTSSLSIAKSGPASVIAGGTVTYTVVIGNAGPSPADGTLVTDPAVANFNATGVTCPSATGGATCPATLTVAALQGAGLSIATFPVGGSVTLSITGTAGASGTILNTATATPPAGSPASSTAPTSINPTSNLSIAKTGPANVTAGATLTYTVVVSNGGPSDAGGTLVVDPAVANFNVTGVTCPSASGGAACPATLSVAALQGAGINIATFPVGGSVTFSITGTAAGSGTIVNTATAAPPAGSPVSSTAPTTTINPTSTLTVAKTGPASVNAGATLTYNVVVTNTGPSDANGTLVVDPAVANFTVTGVTCPSATGGATCPATLTVAALQGAGLNIATFPVGGSVTLSITGTAGASGTIVNIATATPPAGPPASGTAPTTTINPSSSLTIAKTGPANVTAGAALTYTVVVTNPGPSAANGTLVTDPVVPNFTATGVTCPSATGGATCPATLTVAALQGAGLNIATFPVGGSVTFSITGTAGAGGTIVNTATATPPAGSPASSTAPTTTINPTSTLTIAKTGPANVNAGASLTYTVVVTNTGPSAADGTIVQDPAVANFTVTGVTCPSATGGATCPATLTVAALQGAGVNIATFPAGGSVTFSITGTAGASGTIVNVANASPPAGSPVSSTAPTTTIANAGVTLTKAIAPATIAVGSSATLTLTLGNASGQGYALTADFVDTMPAGVTTTGGSTGTCTGVTVTATSVTMAAGSPLPPGGCTIVVTITSSTTGTVTNTTGPLSTSGGNAPPASAPLTVATGTASLAKAIVPGLIVPGASATMTITLGNAGAVPLTLTAPFTDPMPAGMTTTSGNSGTCANVTVTATLVTLPAGSTLPPGGCTIVVGVTTSTPGTTTNVTSPLSAGGTTVPAASAPLVLNTGPMQVPVNSPVALLLAMLAIASIGGARLCRSRMR